MECTHFMAAAPDRAGEIPIPGDFEERTRVSRLRDGIDLDMTTWSQIVETAKSVGIDVDANSTSSL